MMHYHAFSSFYLKRERSRKAKKEESTALVLELFHKPIKILNPFLHHVIRNPVTTTSVLPVQYINLCLLTGK